MAIAEAFPATRRAYDRPCAVCGSHTYKALYHPRQSPGPVVRCENCGLVYVSRIEDDHAIIDEGPVLKGHDPSLLTSATLADLEGSWELGLLPDFQRERPALDANACHALCRIEQYVRPPGRLLDFGCGWGSFLNVAKERNWETYGLEPLPGHALYARARFRVNVTTDILRENTFQRDTFDVVTAFQVFEHLPDPGDVLAKLHRMLRPGGVLLIEVPNIDTWSVRLLSKHHRHFVQDHLTFFSQATLSRFLVTHGFEVVRAYYPARRMTLHHLIVDWGGRFLPARMASWTQRLPPHLMSRVIPMNVGDIVAVMGRKLVD